MIRPVNGQVRGGGGHDGRSPEGRDAVAAVLVRWPVFAPRQRGRALPVAVKKAAALSIASANSSAGRESATIPPPVP